VKSLSLQDKLTGLIYPLGGPAALWAARLLPGIRTEPLETGIAGFAVIGVKGHISLPV
jgi:hypothetical protein